MVNLFGVSIFSIRIYKLIIVANLINLVIEVWHPLMMYISVWLMNHPATPELDPTKPDQHEDNK